MSGTVNGQTLYNVYHEVPTCDSYGNSGVIFISMPIDSVSETDTAINIWYHVEISTNLSYEGNGLKLQPYCISSSGDSILAEEHLMYLGTSNSPSSLYGNHVFSMPKSEQSKAMRVGCILTGAWVKIQNGNLIEVGPYDSGYGWINHYAFFNPRPSNWPSYKSWPEDADPPYVSPDKCWLQFDALSNDVEVPSLSEGKIYYYTSNGTPMKGQAYYYDSSGTPHKAKAVYYYDSTGTPHKCR